MDLQSVETRKGKLEVCSKMLRAADMHGERWGRLGKEMVEGLNSGQWPRLIAVGPAMAGGLKRLYDGHFGHSGMPGKVFEVTCRRDGTLDAEGLGSVYYGVKRLGIKKMEIWGRDLSSSKITLEQLNAANIEGFGGVEVRQASANGSGGDLKDAEAGVLTCSDSRVHAYQVFEGTGIVVVSNAGNVLSPVAIETFISLVEAGAPVLAVLGHSKCGAVGAAMEEAAEPMLSGIIGKIRANLSIEETIPGIAAEMLNALSGYSMLGGSEGLYENGQGSARLQQLIKEKEVERMAFFLNLSNGKVSDISGSAE